MPRYPIVSVKYLRKCQLWEGSLMHSEFKFQGGLSLESVKEKRASLERCDDRTQSEEELLKALQQTIEDPLGLKDEK